MSNYKVEMRSKRAQISATDWMEWSDWYLVFEFLKLEAASSYIETQQNSDLYSSVEREYRIVMRDGSIFTPKPLKKKSAEEKIRAIVSGGNRSHMLDLTFVEMQEIVAALDAKLRMEEQLREMTEAKKRTVRMYGDLIKSSDDPTRIARLDGKMLAYTRVTEQLEAIRNGEDWTA